MPYSESASPGRRLTQADRTHSASSVGRSPPAPGKGKGHRAHLAGHGRVHTRNLSYGKNLNKLTKLVDDAETGGAAGPAHRSKAMSPTSPVDRVGLAKRNSSTVSLPRTGSKANVRRNNSSVSLKRNASHTQVQKSGRPTTPLRKNHSRGADMDKLGKQREAQFMLDDDGDDDGDGDGDDNHDDEWTEESASQSPSVTRHSSSKVTSGKASPEIDAKQLSSYANNRGLEKTAKQRSTPTAAASTGDFVSVPHPDRSEQEHNPVSRPPDADVLTSRLLGRNTSFRLQPQVSSISATGTPDTHTPPPEENCFPSAAKQPQSADDSFPEHGVSHFIGASSSAGGGSSIGHTMAKDSLGRHASQSGVSGFSAKSELSGRTDYSTLSSARSSPSHGVTDADRMRRSKSSGDLLGRPQKPTATEDEPDADGEGSGIHSYTFQAPQQRRTNFTQVRMELWRNQTAIEPSHGPPAAIINRLPVADLDGEERSIRQWEEAQAQITHLKRFRNPIVDSAKRALRGRAATKGAASANGSIRAGKSASTTDLALRQQHHKQDSTTATNANANAATADRHGAAGDRNSTSARPGTANSISIPTDSSTQSNAGRPAETYIGALNAGVGAGTASRSTPEASTSGAASKQEHPNSQDPQASQTTTLMPSSSSEEQHKPEIHSHHHRASGYGEPRGVRFEVGFDGGAGMDEEAEVERRRLEGLLRALWNGEAGFDEAE